MSDKPLKMVGHFEISANRAGVYFLFSGGDLQESFAWVISHEQGGKIGDLLLRAQDDLANKPNEFPFVDLS